MKRIKPIRFDIYIEGGLHTSTKSKAAATKLKQKYEAEGWNVKVRQVYATIVGPIGVSL